MAKRQVVIAGADEILKAMQIAEVKASDVAAKGLYYGAGMLADEVKHQFDNIKTETWRWATDDNKRYPSPQEKGAVSKHFPLGIAGFEKGGTFVSTSVGLGYLKGYIEIRGQRRPLPVVVRSIESGTSFMYKQPFFRKAVNKCKKVVPDRIVEEMQKIFDNIFKED